MSGSSRIHLRLLDVGIGVDCTDEALNRDVRLWYGATLDGGGAEAPALVARIERDAGGWTVRVDGREAGSAEDRETALKVLNHDLVQAVMLQVPDLFYVHAAVVSRNGHGIVLPGLAQAGKSTLALALVQQGARFLSDELLVFDPRARQALCFPRAIKLRDACVPYFPDLAGRLRGTGDRRFLPPAALADHVVIPSTSIAVVALPCYQPDASNDLLPVRRGQALLELASSALNFGTHRSASIDHLADLLRGAATYRLPWSDPHEASRRLLAAVSGLSP